MTMTCRSIIDDPRFYRESRPEFVRLHDDLIKSLDKPDSLWNRAAMSTSQADPLSCRTEIALTCHESFRRGEQLYLKQSADSLIVFTLGKDGICPIFLPVESNWYFGSPLLGPDAIDLLDSALGEINRGRVTWLRPAEFYISGLRSGGRLFRSLKKRFSARYDFSLDIQRILSVASLEDGLDGYLSRRSSNHRRNLKKLANRAVRSGVCFERHVPTTYFEIDELHARMATVARNSWRGLAGIGQLGSTSYGFTYKLLWRLALAGAARVIFARHEGRDIGYIFGGMAGDIYHGHQFSFVADWYKASIGNLLQLEQIRWLCEEGASRYDMGPLMDYKRRWAEKQLNIETWVLAPKRFPAWLASGLPDASSGEQR